jgi:hypothetical protein
MLFGGTDTDTHYTESLEHVAVNRKNTILLQCAANAGTELLIKTPLGSAVSPLLGGIYGKTGG